MASNNNAPISSYLSEMDDGYIDATSINLTNMDSNNTESPINQNENFIIPKKQKNNNFKILFLVLAFIIIGIVIVLIMLPTKTSELISTYDNMKSSFLNKDQIDFDSELNFDKNYLLEQMIYKEFTPNEKKKYLNLPDVLKEKLQIDYLIDKI